MWDYYLNAMLILNRDASTQIALKRRMLGKAYKQADEANRMTIDHYLQYIEIMYAMETDNAIIEKVIYIELTYIPIFMFYVFLDN